MSKACKVDDVRDAFHMKSFIEALLICIRTAWLIFLSLSKWTGQ